MLTLLATRSLVLAGTISILPISVVKAPGVEEQAPTVDDILERHLQAVGGREAVERCSTRVMTGWIVTDLPTWTPPVYEKALVDIHSAMPFGFIVTQQSPEGTWWDGYDGTLRWSSDGGVVKRIDHFDARFAWLLHPQNAVRFREFFPDMRFRGEIELDGRRVYLIDIDDHPSHALGFDARSGLLVRLGYNGVLSDYRAVDGVRVPFHYALSRKGGSSTYTFDRIEHNVPVDRGQFAAPAPRP
jgi:hypothetical protein